MPIFGVGECGGLLYYAMQFIEGEGLDRLIDRLRLGDESRRPRIIRRASPPGAAEPRTTKAADRDGPSARGDRPDHAIFGRRVLAHARRVARIGLQVAEALEYAHTCGFLHRDIKPSNILLDPSGTAWVADFGLAKGAEPDEALTQTGDIVGTLRYMAPERFEGRSDARGDVYASGATLYEMLTLRPGVRRPRPDPADRAGMLESSPVRPARSTAACRATWRRSSSRRWRGTPARDTRRPERSPRTSGDSSRGGPSPPAGPGSASGWSGGCGGGRSWRACTPPSRCWRSRCSGLGGWSYVRINRAQRRGPDSRGAGASLRGPAARTGHRAGRGGAGRPRPVLDAPQPRRRGGRAPGDAPGRPRHNLAAWRDHAVVPRLIRPTDSPIDAMALSPDGRMAVTGHRDGSIKSWDLTSGSLLVSVQAHGSSAFRVSFRAAWAGGRVERTPPRSHSAALGRPDPPAARPADAARGRLAGLPSLPARRRRLVTYSPEDGTVRSWDGATGRLLHPPLSHPGRRHAAFSPDGRRLATVGRSREARLWDVATARPIGEPLRHHRSIVWGAAFSPDGRRLATVNGDFQVQGPDARLEGRVRIWDAATGRPIAAGPAVRPGLWTVAFHPDGRKLVAGGFNGFAQIYDAEAAEPIGAPMLHTEWVRQFAFSPDGRMILTASEDGSARLFDAETGRPLGSIMEHGGSVEAAGFGPEGRTIVTASTDGSLRIWDCTGADSAAVRCASLPASKPPRSAPTPASSPRRASTARPGVFDIADGQPAGPPLIHSARVRAARFRPDGRVLATAGDDEAVRLWDARPGHPLGPPLPHGHWVVNLRFSPDGRKLLAGRVEGVARLWDLATFRPIGRGARAPEQDPGPRRLERGVHPGWPDGDHRQRRRHRGVLGRETGRRWAISSASPRRRPAVPIRASGRRLVCPGPRSGPYRRLPLRREIARPFGDRSSRSPSAPTARPCSPGRGKTARL